MAISGYFKVNYYRLLMPIGGAILLMAIGGYFRLNYHRILVVIDDYYISDYWWLFLLMAIGGYYISDNCWIF